MKCNSYKHNPHETALLMKYKIESEMKSEMEYKTKSSSFGLLFTSHI
jgi:hypothetical protein